jgi:hypothetical protein
MASQRRRCEHRALGDRGGEKIYAHVDSGTHTAEEKFSFEEDLPIGDGDDVGGASQIPDSAIVARLIRARE